jgi:hypothetical protein
MDSFPENTRSSFKNVFPKTARVSEIKNELYICLDQLNFEQTYNSYNNKGIMAFRYNHITKEIPNGKMYEFTIDNVHYTIDSLLSEVNEKIKKSSFNFMKIEKDKINPNYINLTILKEYDVAFSKYFWDFLKLPETVLKKGVTYRSQKPVELIENFPEYVNVVCEEVDEYSNNSSFSKIIASVPINKEYFGGSVHHDSEHYQYFRLSSNNINTISIELRHPNNTKLFLSRGPPTIIKANIKEMNPSNEFFYVQVSSAPSSNNPSNTISKFNITLPREYDLSGEWKVAMTNLFLPGNNLHIFKHDYNVYHFPNEDDRKILFVRTTANNYFRDTATTSMSLPYVFIFEKESFTRYEFMKSFKEKFSNFFSVEVDSDENFIISTEKHELNEYTKIHFYITPKLRELIFKDYDRSNLGNFSLPIFDKLPPILQGEVVKFKEPDRLIKASFQPIDYRKKFGSKKDFIDRINFDLYYEEIDEDTFEEKEDAKKAKTKNTKSRKKAQEIIETLSREEDSKSSAFDVREFNPAWMFIYSDFVSPTIIGDKFNNLLKLVPYKNNQKSGGFYNFSSLDFFNVNKQNIRTLEFNIKTHSGSDYKFFNNDNASLTLIFKKFA